MDKIIILVGPTGVGKTALSISLAKRFNGEIISGDAYQVYQEMNIGTAKIKESEKEGIPHYLVDYVSYREEYNVKVFQEAGRQYIKDILNRGKVPIICGGTGLYIKALLYDYVFEEEQVDFAYQEEIKQKDTIELYQKLLLIDKEACNQIHPNNRKRIIRALMMAHSGKSKSERLRKQEHKPIYDAYIIGLTMEREALYERINERVNTMIANGLEQEMDALVKQREDFSLCSMQGIGYKEWKAYYDKEATLIETIALIQKNTRHFAKRQYTWFHHQMDVQWYDTLTQTKDIEKEVATFLGG